MGEPAMSCCEERSRQGILTKEQSELGAIFRDSLATDENTAEIYRSLIKEDFNDATLGWRLLCEKIDPDGAIIVRLHSRPWLGIGEMMRLECTYRGCTVEGISKALEHMLENGAPELAEVEVKVLSKEQATNASGLLPAGALIETVYQKMPAPVFFMSPREHVLRFGMGFIEPTEGSKADSVTRILFDTQTSCQHAEYPNRPGVVRMNQAKTTTYEQRGGDVYSIEFMFTDAGGWIPQSMVLQMMKHGMEEIIEKLTKKYSGFSHAETKDTVQNK